MIAESCAPSPSVYYRYQETHYAPPVDEFDTPIGEGSTDVKCLEFRVAKQTPKGVRLDNGKLVLHQSLKKYANPTPSEALAAFIARKKAHRKILCARIRKIERALETARRKFS
jgi:hypothetical protein